MKVTLLNITFLLWLLTIALGYGQQSLLERKVTIRFDNQSVSRALEQLQNEGNCTITYQPSDLPQDKVVSRYFEQTEIGTIIKEIWGSDQLKFLAVGDNITIRSLAKKGTKKKRGSIKGRIIQRNKKPLPGVTVLLVDTPYGAASNIDGYYELKNIPVGTYKLEISSIGFQKIAKTVNIQNNGLLQLNFVMDESTSELEEIVVLGKTEAKTINEEAITINSIDVKKIQNQAIGTEEALKTTTGVVVRQNGGLGSNVSINLNGLSGNEVRIFYDGIPLEVYSNGLQLNTVPVDALERVDVYKGVIPIDVGTDALGGGINLIPARQTDDYLRTSYSGASFNTHRVTFNGLKNLSSKTSLSTISYLNYSDNDFVMRNIRNQVEIELPDGSQGFDEETISARRFHDRHVSGFIEGRLRIKNMKWADRLELASSYFRRADEIQNGGFITTTSIGEAETEIDVFTQRIDYRKNFLKDRLGLRYFGILSFAVDKINDNSTNIFDWRGQILNRTNASGSEIFGTPTALERENLGTAHRLTVDFNITDNIDFKVSDYYRYTRLKGEDALGERILIEDELIDLNTLPSTLNRNIFGAELDALFFEEKLNVISFFKNYSYRAKSIDVFEVGANRLVFNEIRNNSNGYGFAVKYQLNPSIFIRTSIEEAIRIPTEAEIFGDLAATIPNFDLEPEESLNWNVGVQFEKRFDTNRFFLVNVNGFVRNRENLIRPVQVSFSRIQFRNEDVVDGKGIELALKVNPLKSLLLQGNFTTQSNEIDSGVDIGKQVPNIPLTFYNLGANYEIENLLKQGNNLQISWTYLFTDKFSINTVEDLDTANPEAFVPKQSVHNAGLSYQLKQKGLAFSFNLQNVFNVEVFDNFRVPRPGINYAFKINYSL